jgi:CBS-domain-containing membrane protein
MAVRLTMHLPRDVAPRRLYRYAWGPADRVADAMTWPAVTIEVSASVEEARALAAQAWVHYLPVVHRLHLIGLTCVCDLAQAPARRPVAEHMPREVASVGVATSSADAAQLMLARGLDGLPVTASRSTIGFLTLGDLVRTSTIDIATRPLCRTCGTRRHLVRSVGEVSFCRDCLASASPMTGDPYEELGGGD